jgi:hypothetical protein
MKPLFYSIIAWLIYHYFNLIYQLYHAKNEVIEIQPQEVLKEVEPFYNKDYQNGSIQTLQKITVENSGFSWEIKSNGTPTNNQYNGNLVAINEQRKANKQSTTIGK